MRLPQGRKTARVFNGSCSSIYLSIVLFMVIGIVVFTLLSFVVPPLLRLPFAGVILIAIVILVLSIVQQRKGFYLEQGNDGSLRVVRASGPIAEETVNGFQISLNGTCLNLTKDNIAAVSLPSEEDRKRIWDWLPERRALMIFNPFKRALYDWRLMKNVGMKEYERGFGPYSIAFVSRMDDLVKILVHTLHVKDALQESDVENALIFVSLKEHEDFISSCSDSVGTSSRMIPNP